MKFLFSEFSWKTFFARFPGGWLSENSESNDKNGFTCMIHSLDDATPRIESKEVSWKHLYWKNIGTIHLITLFNTWSDIYVSFIW